MTNQQHVDRLKSGVQVWNEWRLKHPEVIPDLQGADLTGIELRGVDLHGANLQGAYLTKANLQEANFAFADLRKSSLRAASLQKANLYFANLQECSLRAANLHEANLLQAKNLILDSSFVRHARFDVHARDPWSILRRKYTGPSLMFNLLFLLAFLVPYVVKVLFWASVNRLQSYTEVVFLEQENLTVVDSKAATNLSRCLADDCESITVLELVLGFDKGLLFWVFPIMLITYNLLKGWLTWKVAPMRDEEERSGYVPEWKGAGRPVRHQAIPFLGNRVSKNFLIWCWKQMDSLRGYRYLFWTHHYFLRWVFWLAFVAFVVNAWHWFTQIVWIPS